MRTVRFVEGDSVWPYVRQSPNHDGVFGKTRFLFGSGPEHTDWLVVKNAIPTVGVPDFPQDRTIFVGGEPPTFLRVDPDFVAQFGAALTVDRGLAHPQPIYRAPLTPWHVGIRTYDRDLYPGAMTFAELAQVPKKTRLCSCIASTMTSTPGHRARLAFVRKLQRALGDRIDFYGRGIREIPDKNEALAPYRYHIAIENSIVQDYWTEKLADPFLRNCFPIYAGAPNVTDYFDPSSLRAIDIADHATAIEMIARVIESDRDFRSADAIAEAKRRVLWEHNILAWVDHFVDEAERRGTSPGAVRSLRPQSAFRPPKSLPWYVKAGDNIALEFKRLRRRVARIHD